MSLREKAVRDVRQQLARRYTVVHLAPELAEALAGSPKRHLKKGLL